MGQVVEIISPRNGHKGFGRRRVWVDLGRPLIIGPKLTATLFVDRINGQRLTVRMPRLAVRGPGAVFDADIPPECWVDLDRWAGLMGCVRAVELSSTGLPLRYLVEFVAVRQGVKFAPQ